MRKAYITQRFLFYLLLLPLALVLLAFFITNPILYGQFGESYTDVRMGGSRGGPTITTFWRNVYTLVTTQTQRTRSFLIVTETTTGTQRGITYTWTFTSVVDTYTVETVPHTVLTDLYGPYTTTLKEWERWERRALPTGAAGERALAPPAVNGMLAATAPRERDVGPAPTDAPAPTTVLDAYPTITAAPERRAADPEPKHELFKRRRGGGSGAGGGGASDLPPTVGVAIAGIVWLGLFLLWLASRKYRSISNELVDLFFMLIFGIGVMVAATLIFPVNFWLGTCIKAFGWMFVASLIAVMLWMFIHTRQHFKDRIGESFETIERSGDTATAPAPTPPHDPKVDEELPLQIMYHPPQPQPPPPQGSQVPQFQPAPHGQHTSFPPPPHGYGYAQAPSTSPPPPGAPYAVPPGHMLVPSGPNPAQPNPIPYLEHQVQQTPSPQMQPAYPQPVYNQAQQGQIPPGAAGAYYQQQPGWYPPPPPQQVQQ